MTPGASASFDLQIQNEGTADDSFLTKGCGDTPDLSARYYVGSTDVTSDVVSGSYTGGSLAPSERVFLSLEVSVSHAATVGDDKRCRFTATSVTSPTK